MSVQHGAVIPEAAGTFLGNRMFGHVLLGEIGDLRRFPDRPGFCNRVGTSQNIRQQASGDVARFVKGKRRPILPNRFAFRTPCLAVAVFNHKTRYAGRFDPKAETRKVRVLPGSPRVRSNPMRWGQRRVLIYDFIDLAVSVTPGRWCRCRRSSTRGEMYWACPGAGRAGVWQDHRACNAASEALCTKVGLAAMCVPCYSCASYEGEIRNGLEYTRRPRNQVWDGNQHVRTRRR